MTNTEFRPVLAFLCVKCQDFPVNAAQTQRGSLFIRTLRVLRIVIDVFPLTPLGVLTALGAWLALRYAQEMMDLVLLIVGLTAAGVLMMTCLFALISSFWVRRKLKQLPTLDSLHVETQRATQTGFSVPSLRWFPFVRLSWRWGERGVDVDARLFRNERREWVTFAKRGLFEGAERRFAVEGILGFSRVVIRQTQAHPVIWVMPHLGALSRVSDLHSFSGGNEISHPLGTIEGDRVDLRRYYPGDPARFIHWKVYARTRTLMLRSPEAAVSRSRRVVCYLVSGPSDEASAACARYLLQSALVGERWTFAADGAPNPTEDLGEALRKIAQSRDVYLREETALAYFLSNVENSEPLFINLFVPPVRDRWFEPVLAALKKRGAQVRVWIGIDSFEERRSVWWKRLFLLSNETSPVSTHELTRICRAFRALRSEVKIVERTSGRLVDETSFKAVSERPVRLSEGPPLQALSRGRAR